MSYTLLMYIFNQVEREKESLEEMNAAKKRLSEAIMLIEPLVDDRFIVPFQVTKPLRPKFANHLLKPSLELIAMTFQSTLTCYIKWLKVGAKKKKNLNLGKKLNQSLSQYLLYYKKQIIKSIKSKKRAKSDPLIQFSDDLKANVHPLQQLFNSIINYATSIDFTILEEYKSVKEKASLDGFLYLTNFFLNQVMVDIFDIVANFWKQVLESVLNKQEWQDGYIWWQEYLQDNIMSTLILFRLDKEETRYRPLSFVTREALTWYVAEQDDNKFKDILIKINKSLYTWFEFLTKSKKNVVTKNNDDVYFIAKLRLMMDHHLLTCFKSSEDIAFLLIWARILHDYNESDSVYQRPKSFFKDKELPWRIVNKLEIEFQFPGMGLVELDVDDIFKEHAKKKRTHRKRREMLHADVVKFLYKARLEKDIEWYPEVEAKGYSWSFQRPVLNDDQFE